MDVHVQRAEAVRQACIAAPLQASEEAGISGLCHERKGVHAITLSCGAVADGRLPPRWLAR
jgi:hypothetical protein